MLQNANRDTNMNAPEHKTIDQLESEDARALDEMAAVIRGTRSHCERMEASGRYEEARGSMERRRKLAGDAMRRIVNYL